MKNLLLLRHELKVYYVYILHVNSIVVLYCKFYIKSTECTYCGIKVQIFLGTQSAVLLKLKKLRDRKYNKKPPLCTALDDLYICGALQLCLPYPDETTGASAEGWVEFNRKTCLS